MQMLVQLFDQLHAEHYHGGGSPSKLDLINSPAQPDGDITMNRRQVFKEYNYRFHS